MIVLFIIVLIFIALVWYARLFIEAFFGPHK